MPGDPMLGTVYQRAVCISMIIEYEVDVPSGLCAGVLLQGLTGAHPSKDNDGGRCLVCPV
jgi:hypothetical protein